MGANNRIWFLGSQESEITIVIKVVEQFEKALFPVRFGFSFLIKVSPQFRCLVDEVQIRSGIQLLECGGGEIETIVVLRLHWNVEALRSSMKCLGGSQVSSASGGRQDQDFEVVHEIAWLVATGKRNPPSS